MTSLTADQREEMLEYFRPIIRQFKHALADRRGAGVSEDEIREALKLVERKWTGLMHPDDLASVMGELYTAGRVLIDAPSSLQ